MAFAASNTLAERCGPIGLQSSTWVPETHARLGSTVLALAPFLAVGAFLPTWTLYVVILLGTKRPLANGARVRRGQRRLPARARRRGTGRCRAAANRPRRWREPSRASASCRAARRAVPRARARPVASAGVVGSRCWHAQGPRTARADAAVAGVRPGVRVLRSSGRAVALPAGRARRRAGPRAQLAAELAWLVAIVFVLELMLLAPLVIYLVAARARRRTARAIPGMAGAATPLARLRTAGHGRTLLLVRRAAVVVAAVGRVPEVLERLAHGFADPNARGRPSCRPARRSDGSCSARPRPSRR